VLIGQGTVSDNVITLAEFFNSAGPSGDTSNLRDELEY